MFSAGLRRAVTVVFCSLCLAVLAAQSGEAWAQPVAVTDDWGQTIHLPRPADRIIPLYGAFSEILFAIGAGGRVVARTEADRDPPAIEELPSVGTHMRPNVETILGMKPQLVLQSASRRAALPEIHKLIEAGVPVAVFAPQTFPEIFATIQRLGTLSGSQEAAGMLVARLRERLQVVRNRVGQSGQRPRVFFEVRAEPLTAAGRGGIVEQILEAAGAENIVRGDKAMVQYSIEALLLEDPDVYILQTGPMNRSPMDPRERIHFKRLRAVRSQRVLRVDEHLYSRPGPRAVDAVEELARALHEQSGVEVAEP
jgi:iron complex transport system substrate-binding protein